MAASGSGISVSVIGDEAGVQRHLHALDTALNPLAIAGFLGAEVAPYLATRVKARFASEGDDVSGSWLPLSPATHGFRERGREQGMWSVGDAHPINVRTHELEDYLSSGVGDVLPTGLGATLRYPRPTNRKSIRDKMETAQRGRAEPRTPSRPVLGINERDLGAVLYMLAFHIKEVGGGRL